MNRRENGLVAEFDSIIGDAPVDFLGTGSDSKFAKKEEKEWNGRVEKFRSKLDAMEEIIGQAVYEYLKDNLRLSVVELPQVGYGYDTSRNYNISLILKNPKGVEEVLSSDILSCPFE